MKDPHFFGALSQHLSHDILPEFEGSQRAQFFEANRYLANRTHEFETQYFRLATADPRRLRSGAIEFGFYVLGQLVCMQVELALNPVALRKQKVKSSVLKIASSASQKAPWQFRLIIQQFRDGTVMRFHLPILD